MGDCCEEACNAEFSFYPCGANQPYICLDPKHSGVGVAQTRGVLRDNYLDGFETNDFDPNHWKWMNGDAAWAIEAGVAAEGRRYAEARTDDIVDVGGSAVLSLAVDSPRGGTLSYSIQALIQAPFEDLVLKLDYTIVKVFTSAAPEWTEHEMEVTAGSHTVSWVHRKNPGDASEGDLAAERLQPGITRVDDVRWTM